MTSVFAEEGAGGTPWKSPVLLHHMTPVLWRPTAAGTRSADLDLADGVPLLTPASLRDEAVARCVWKLRTWLPSILHRALLASSWAASPQQAGAASEISA